MNTNWKAFKTLTPLLPSQSSFDPDNENSSQVVDHDNEEKIQWKKTNDEDQNSNYK